ncbi:MAG: capsule assembly Wzi family protein [Terracidiphilus sp.]|nr:capsule assembly Wzi family protein [Terracidiphilus sp.]
MGYVKHVYLGMRPWTRASLSYVLEDIDAQIEAADTYGVSTVGEAQDIYAALIHFLHYDAGMQCLTRQGSYHTESVYSVTRGISGTPLRDSFHLGSTIINDYGRPYENGINNYSGASGYVAAGRYILYVRGEFQSAPSAAGYSAALAQAIANNIDITAYANSTGIPYSQATIPMGLIGTKTVGRFMEAYVSAQYLNHVISFGRQDDWLGSGLGGGMAFSNNAVNFYSFRINRIEPLRFRCSPGLPVPSAMSSWSERSEGTPICPTRRIPVAPIPICQT